METLILIIHVILAIVLIALILLQQGKGADAGASFGAGASQTVFGGRGSSSFLVKLTSIVAVILLVTSITLDIMTKHKAESLTTGGIPVSSQQNAPASSEVPQVQQSKPEQGRLEGNNQSDIPTVSTSSEKGKTSPEKKATNDNK